MDELIRPLANYGALGVLAFWFMWRNEQKLEKVAFAQLQVALQMARLQVILAMSMPQIPEQLRQMAEQSVQELESQVRAPNGRGARP